MTTHRLKNRRKPPQRPPNRYRKRRRRKRPKPSSSQRSAQRGPSHKPQRQSKQMYRNDRKMSRSLSSRVRMYRLFKVKRARNSESKTRTYHNLLTPNCSKPSGPQIGARASSRALLSRRRLRTWQGRHSNFRSQRSSSSRTSRHQILHR